MRWCITLFSNKQGGLGFHKVVHIQKKSPTALVWRWQQFCNWSQTWPGAYIVYINTTCLHLKFAPLAKPIIKATNYPHTLWPPQFWLEVQMQRHTRVTNVHIHTYIDKACLTQQDHNPMIHAQHWSGPDWWWKFMLVTIITSVRFIIHQVFPHEHFGPSGSQFTTKEYTFYLKSATYIPCPFALCPLQHIIQNVPITRSHNLAIHISVVNTHAHTNNLQLNLHWSRYYT